MKTIIKIFISTCLIVACVLIAQNKKNQLKIDLAMENIEAIAAGEGGAGICGGSGSIDCGGIKYGWRANSR